MNPWLHEFALKPALKLEVSAVGPASARHGRDFRGGWSSSCSTSSCSGGYRGAAARSSHGLWAPGGVGLSDVQRFPRSSAAGRSAAAPRWPAVGRGPCHCPRPSGVSPQATAFALPCRIIRRKLVGIPTMYLGIMILVQPYRTSTSSTRYYLKVVLLDCKVY